MILRREVVLASTATKRALFSVGVLKLLSPSAVRPGVLDSASPHPGRTARFFERGLGELALFVVSGFGRFPEKLVAMKGAKLLDWAVAGPNYLTPDGARALQDELRHLSSSERPKVVSEVADAAAQGDRSENAEYTYGKKRLREIDRRIRFLTKRLESAVLVQPGLVQHDQVRFGAIVVVKEESGAERTYRLVGPDESNPAAGALSFQSPIGKALMKKRVGDFVVVHRPIGELELEIVSIKYE